MAQNFKPVIDEIKSKLRDREQIRETVVQNIKLTRDMVEKKLKDVAGQAKDSRFVHEYVIPFVESEKADQAMKYLNDKLGSNKIVSTLEHARKAIIDLKVSQAKPAEKAPEA